MRTLSEMYIVKNGNHGYDTHLTERALSWFVRSLKMYGADIYFVIGWNAKCPVREMRHVYELLGFIKEQEK